MARFVILGAGAIGSVFGACLARAGHRVELVGRAPHLDAIRGSGLRVTGLLGEFTVEGFGLATALADLPPSPSADAVLLAVKSQDTARAIDELGSWGGVGPDTTVASLQNGLGNLERLSAAFGPRALAARVIFGAELLGPGRVLVSVWGDRVLVGGEDPGRARELARILKGAGLETEAVEKIEPFLWGKVLYNASLNPLSALLEVPYGALGETPPARALLDQLIREAFRVAAAEVALPWRTEEEYLELFFMKLLPATSAHLSSMLQDLRRDRPLEIEALNGEIIRRGRLRAIPTPTHETIHRLLLAKVVLHRPLAGTPPTS